MQVYLLIIGDESLVALAESREQDQACQPGAECFHRISNETLR